MDWYAGTCAGSICSQSSANVKQNIALVESVNGGPFRPTGEPGTGVIHEQISPEAKNFNQHWLVDGKRVQLIVGNNKGTLIKTWEVHVVIKQMGARPVYSAVP